MLKKCVDQSGMAHIIQKERATAHPYDGDRTSNIHSVHQSLQIQQHDWGGGISLCERNDSERQSPKEGDSELQQRRNGICRSALLRSVLNPSDGVTMPDNDRGTSSTERHSNESAAVASMSSGSNEKRQRNTAVIEAIDKRMSLPGSFEGFRISIYCASN